MLRVLAVIPSGAVYGLQNVALDFFGNLSKQDFDYHFFVTQWTDGAFTRRLDELKIPYTYSWLGMFSRKLDWNNLKMTFHCLLKVPRLYFDFVALIKSYQPNIIFTANHHELILLAPLLKLVGLPVVNHMHDPPLPIAFQRGMFRLWDRLVSKYLVVSRDVQKRLEALGTEPDKILLLYNGIDLSLFQNGLQRSKYFVEHYGWPSQSIILGMTSQMITEKGHSDLIEAVRLLRKDYPNIRLVIGGKRAGQYYQRLVSKSANKGLSDIVVFSGWQEDVRNFFSGIDIFVSPSRHEEGFGLVVAQAMAMGLPVVASRSGGVNEVVEDRVTGFLVKKASPPQLANAISYLVKSKSLRQSMGISGRKRVEEQFNLQKQSARLETVLKTLVNGVNTLNHD